MSCKRACLSTGFFVIITFLCLIPFRSTHSAFLYKRYIVRYDRGWDILCEPYVVKKNDWVFKLFRQKGEIAHEDFPEFLRVFKRINPHVRDIDRIRPGQHIMIPLKKLSQESLREQPSNVVTIPFVTISNKDETPASSSSTYRVQSGDCVSILIARKYGAYGTKSYSEGIKLFKLNNPDINDLDHIYSGQIIVIPDINTGGRAWNQTLNNRLSEDNKTAAFDYLIPEIMENKPKPPLVEVASALDATFYDKGNYYFPRSGKEDFKLDLGEFPIIELKNGKRLFFLKDNNPHESTLNAVKSHWKDIDVVRMTPNASVKQVFETVFGQMGKDQLKDRLLFSDNGVDVEVRGKWIIDRWTDGGKTIRHICITFIDGPGERTPQSILRYLDQNNIVIKEVLTNDNAVATKNPQPLHNPSSLEVVTINPSDHKALVKQLIDAVGYQYAPNINISFPYAGVQVGAVSNLITKTDGSTFLIDFGDLHGDAIHTIEKTGLDIIQIKMKDDLQTIMQKILNTIDVSFSSHPIFLAAHRPAVHNTMFTIPGFLVDTSGGSKVLVSLAPLHSGVIRFLTNEGIKVVLVASQSKST